MSNNSFVDIIIPIYNAYDDLTQCVASVERNTDFANARLVLVNDNSPDERIIPYLESCKARGHYVINNEVNHGFSYNVNLGMRLTDTNDVILLNSDTIVTRGWLDKMRECAYSNASIGTVTPLSNNATLCSIPKFLEENKLPDGLTIDETAQIVEEYSFREYPRISVAHGFCMYIKREVIDNIGLFDAETFKRGYGEENDFCNRAEEAGYIHVMCDNVYIYHSGTKSFLSDEKMKLIQDHERILYNRYPILMRKNEEHVRTNPNERVQKNLQFYFDIRNKKKNILYIIHSDFKEGSENNVGGTQLHLKDLSLNLRDEYNIFVAARNGENLDVTAYLPEKEYTFRFYIGQKDPYFKNSDRAIRKVLETIIDAFRIDLVHVHNLSGLSFDIFEISNERDIPLLFTVHDFFLICPVLQLVNHRDKCCYGIASDSCRACMQDKKDIISSIDRITIWHRTVAKYLDMCDTLIFPSESAKNIFLNVYKYWKGITTVIEHGVDTNVDQQACSVTYDYEHFRSDIDRISVDKSFISIAGRTYYSDYRSETDEVRLLVAANHERIEVPVVLSEIDYRNGIAARFTACIPVNLFNDDAISVEPFIKRKDDDVTTIYGKVASNTIAIPDRQDAYKLRIAFLGGLDTVKGSKSITEIIKKGPQDVLWYTIGNIGDQKLKEISQKNYKEIGGYKRDNLSSIFKTYQVDAVALLSIFPETYSYCYTEALANNIPVICTDIGALGERTKRDQSGSIISSDNTVEEFLLEVDRLKEAPQLLMTYRENIRKIHLPSVKEMCGVYSELYKDSFRKCNWNRDINTKEIYEARCDVKTYVNSTNGEQLSLELKDYYAIRQSLTYCLVKKLVSIPFPFKYTLMKYINKKRGIG